MYSLKRPFNHNNYFLNVKQQQIILSGLAADSSSEATTASPPPGQLEALALFGEGSRDFDDHSFNDPFQGGGDNYIIEV